MGAEHVRGQHHIDKIKEEEVRRPSWEDIVSAVKWSWEERANEGSLQEHELGTQLTLAELLEIWFEHC